MPDASHWVRLASNIGRGLARIELGGMNPAPREALRRFVIVVGAFVCTGAVGWLIRFFAKPTLDANPQSPIGPVVMALCMGLIFGWIGFSWFVYRILRSKCPKCHERSTKLV